ncbi:Immunoreactive 84kD antigen PG93 [hydrothermal vent metagenome]|uniref:Immunoreactive 84kD antigen PG93 n=1 Tax=hydrothermal vent metagenome TaxID=652676 RepID=A0A3B0R284_9ZZZZ
MKKKSAVLIIVALCSVFTRAQDFTALWEGHFSYLNITDVVQGGNKIYAASENAIFSYDLNSSEIEKISTVNGLSGELISTIHYSENFNQLIIGYENGLIEVFLADTDEVVTVVDIIDKQTIPPDNKRINHFNEYNGNVYISSDFGISVYDLSRLEFGDTYFIGNGGSQIKVTQTAVFEDYIYAACSNNSGIRKGSLDSSNLIDFQEWTQIIGGNFYGIETLENKLFTTRFNRTIYEISNDLLIALFTYTNTPLDLKSSNSNLVVTTQDQVFVYDANFNVLANPMVTSEFDTKFTAAVTTNEGIYMGTEGFGVLKTTLANPTVFIEIYPDGPLKNNTFSIEAGFGSLWATYGDYTFDYNSFPLREYGLSHLQNEQWINTPYDSLFNSRNLNAISINPLNPRQVFISSFKDGILEINNNEPIIRYDQTNSGLESLILPNNPNFVGIRVSGTSFDTNGLLWSISSLVQKPLKSFDPSSNQWRSYDFSELIPEAFDNLGFKDLVVDSSGIVFVTTFSFGVIGFNPQNGAIKNISDGDGNLPVKFTRAIALDKRNQLWIGTHNGLRVLFNTSNFFSDENVTTEPIIILEDGIPKELLEEQFISDIKVDGSNNKWVATIGAGLFYFSSDGQQTIFHFTKDNSPLPSNTINDVSIDTNNGLVYIATDRGLLSFKAGGSSPKDELSDAYVYPNPVRPAFDAISKKIKIKGITDNVNIKITDIEGNLVAEAQSRNNLRYRGYNLEIDGGTAFWNGKNLANNKVASGVYLIMISDLDTFETKVLKLMIVR